MEKTKIDHIDDTAFVCQACPLLACMRAVHGVSASLVCLTLAEPAELPTAYHPHRSTVTRVARRNNTEILTLPPLTSSHHLSQHWPFARGVAYVVVGWRGMVERRGTERDTGR